jgi:hypothetical protein
MTLFLLLFFLLVLYVSPDFIVVQTYRTYKVTSRPKTITSIRLFLQPWITLEDLDCQFPLQSTHQNRYRNFRWYGNHQINMVRLDIQLQHFTTLPFTKHSNIFLNQSLHSSIQYPKTIFGNPNITAHSPNIRHSHQNLTTV